MEKERGGSSSSNNGVVVVGGRDNNNNNSSGGVRTGETTSRQQGTTDFVLQWGNRKRLRCMKVHGDQAPNHAKTTARVDRRVVRSDPNSSSNCGGGGYLNLRQRPSSPPFPHNRVLRNSENSSAMRSQLNGGGLRNFSASSAAAASNGHHHHRNGATHNVDVGNHNYNNSSSKAGAGGWMELEGKKGGGGSSSGGSGEGVGMTMPAVWPPKFVIALTNKEKEEDFIIFKGSKLPHRPKKRAKMVQRTVNLVSPGSWLCDLTMERYEVREKKISKKRPRGLKAMGNMDSDSE